MQKKYRNKGYMTKAVKRLIKWAFQFENVTAIIAETDKDNLSSKKGYGKNWNGKI